MTSAWSSQEKHVMFFLLKALFYSWRARKTCLQMSLYLVVCKLKSPLFLFFDPVLGWSMMVRGTLVARQKGTLCLPLWPETTGSSSGPPAADSTSAVSLGRPQPRMQVHKHSKICHSVVVAHFLTDTTRDGWFAVFTRTAQASCLVDEPKQIGQYKYPEQLPGQLYDADTQCKWQFGSKAKLCSLDFVKVRYSLYNNK